MDEISKEATSVISPQKAFENNILPLKLNNGILHIALPNKNNLKLINELSFYTGLKIEAVEVSPEIILQKLKEVYPDANLKETSESRNGHNIAEYSNVEFVNQVINEAIKAGASDIHFEVYENNFRIRYRIDGHLREVLNLPSYKVLPVLSRLKIMANLDISEKRRPQDGKISFQLGNRNIDIRVSTLPTSFGEKTVLRILDKSQINLDIKKMGLTQQQLNILTKNLQLPYGMILVTGPTGSGKTTTLYAALEFIHSIEKNIITIEDPIEYNLPGINQSNVKPDIGYDFANALRAFLRQDPDVIMVGEIRDKETAEIAIRASLTGHLVFSTLHTNDSLSAITRLIDMGIEPYLVASSVKIIIAQRLVRVLCNCKIKNPHEDDYQKKGCSACSGTGYKGRSAIFEMIELDEQYTTLISKNVSLSEIRDFAKKRGFVSLRDAGIEKIKNGLTTYEEVLRETSV